MRIMLAVLLVAVISVQSRAEQPTSYQRPLKTSIRLDEYFCEAHTAEGFIYLTQCITKVKTLKRNRADGKIGHDQYRMSVKELINNAQSLGVNIRG